MSGMLLGAVSDTHLFGVPLPDRVLEALSGVDMILHAGDILEMAVLDRLSEVAETVAVKGNMDHGEVARLLPDRRELEFDGFKVGLTHGYGPPTSMTRKVGAMFPDADCVVFGHTHHPLVKEKSGVLFVNPGSPTDRMFARRHTVGLIEITDKIEARIIDI